MILDVEKLAAEIMAEPVRKWNNRKLPDLGVLQPEKDDESVLFRHNWLAIGQAFGLVASSGVGKSSMTDQMALHWSIGAGFLAEPLRQLKIAVIQAEDSDRDLKEQRDGMIKGMLSEGFSMAQIERAFDAVDFPTDFIGIQGEDFISRLTDYQSDCRYDLIFINPLQRFFGGDVSSQEDASKFCAGLDTILKHPEYGCAMGIVMHTPKFHSGIKDGRQSVDDYAEYAMAGSQEWTAWIRAVINFQKHGSSEDYFDIKASKRGKRLGWKDADGNPITKRIFKHCDGFIYWQEVIDPEEIAAIPSEKQSKTKKEPFDAPACALQIASQLADSHGLKSSKPLCKNALVKVAYTAIKGLGRTFANAEEVVEEIWRDPASYGLRVVKHPKYSGETIELMEVQDEL